MQLFFYQQPRVANFVNVFYSLKIKVHTFLYFCHKIIWVNGNRINVQLLYTVNSQFKAHTRILAQLELRPTTELRVFIIARALN